jgi:hypothetical protein
MVLLGGEAISAIQGERESKRVAERVGTITRLWQL